MASAVAKRSDHRASRSASWSVMHSDEELARILQMQEEKEYQDHLAAKEVQCQSDHRLARLLSEHGGHHDGGMDFDEFRETRRRQTRQSSRSATNSTNAAAGTNFQTAAALSITDSDTDFSDCFEDSTFDDLTSALERAQNEADCLAEQQDVADALTRNDEIAEALQNDEQLNRMVENELELSGSIGEPGNALFHPIVVSSSSPVNSASIGTGSDLSNRRNEPMEFSPVDLSNNDDWTSQNESAFSPGTSSANNSLLTSVNIAWNVVGSAVNWVSELFSGVQPPQASNVSNRVTVHAAGDAEEDDDEEEEEGCEEDDGWETEDSDDFGDFDEEEEDDDDDEDRDFDIIESDMDESDDDNNEVLVGFGNAIVVGRGRGLVQSEIDVLPTRTYQSRPPQSTTTTMSGAADAGANEHQCHNECQVCLSSFADGEVLRTLPCCHQFHSECIDVWLQRNAICPVCRVRIRDEIGCR